MIDSKLDISLQNINNSIITGSRVLARNRENTMKITVEVKNNYGVEAVYPVSDNAKTLARIAGTKTLTFSVLQAIKQLGYEIEVQQQVITL